MKYSNLMPCDGEKLKSGIRRRGMTVAEAGQKIGFSRKALQNAVALNAISKPMVLLLKSEFNLEYEEYKRDEEPEVVSKPAEESESEEKMREMIKAATFEAVSEFFASEKFTEMLNAAVNRALN